MSGSTSYARDTVVLVADTFGTSSYHGSGVLVAPDEVLTAAHLVWHEGTGTAETVVVAPGYDSPGGAPYGFVTVTGYHYIQIDDTDDKISHRDSQFDFALLHLSRPLTDLGTMGIQADFGGGTATVAGYPGHSLSQTVVSESFTVNSDYTELNGTPLGPGSSGGPVWINLNGSPYVVGIVSSSNDAQTFGTFGQITNQVLTQINAWEAQDAAAPPQGGQATPEPSQSQPDTAVSVDFASSGAIVVNDGGQPFVRAGGGSAGFHLTDSITTIDFTDSTAAVIDPSGASEAIARLYPAALDRGPDAGGLAHWTQLYDAGETLVSIAGQFVASSEFTNRYGTPDDSVFVNELYYNVLGRAGDAAGIQNWLGQLAHGTTRGSVLVGFADSPENIMRNLTTTGDAHTAEAYRLYLAALDRTPDAGGLQHWTGLLNAGDSAVDVAQGFVGSQEFMSRYGTLDNSAFVDLLYHNVLGRAADSAGAANWLNQLAAGTSRAQVLLGFSDSLENRTNTAAATHDGWTLAGR